MLKDNLSNIRKANNLTQKQLAELTGVSTNYIARLEGGQRESASPEVIQKLCVALNTTRHRLLSSGQTLSFRHIFLNLMESHNISIDILSKETSISVTSLSSILNGSTVPSIQQLEAIAKVFHLNPLELASYLPLSKKEKRLEPIYSFDTSLDTISIRYQQKNDAYFLQLEHLLTDPELIKLLISNFMTSKKSSQSEKLTLFEYAGEEYFKNKKN